MKVSKTVILELSDHEAKVLEKLLGNLSVADHQTRGLSAVESEVLAEIYASICSEEE